MRKLSLKKFTNKRHIVTQEIPRHFETLGQEPGTKNSCVLYNVTLNKCSKRFVGPSTMRGFGK